MKKHKIKFIYISAFTILLLPAYVNAQTTIPCEDKPFSTFFESENIRITNPDCYALRSKYEILNLTSENSLQNIALPEQELNTAIEGLQNGLKLLQQLQNSANSVSDSNQINTTSVKSEQSLPELNSYGDGAAPTLYYQTSNNTNTPSQPEALNQTDFNKAENAEFIDIKTGERLTWRQIQERAGTKELTSTEIFETLLKRPPFNSGISNPLSPNFFTSINDNLNALSNLNTQPDNTNQNSLVANITLNPLSSGIFSPLQNLVVGISNSITSLLESAFAK